MNVEIILGRGCWTITTILYYVILAVVNIKRKGRWWHGNVFLITGSLLGPSSGHRWFPPQRTSNTGLWISFVASLNRPLNKQLTCRAFKRHGVHVKSLLWMHQLMSAHIYLCREKKTSYKWSCTDNKAAETHTLIRNNRLEIHGIMSHSLVFFIKSVIQQPIEMQYEFALSNQRIKRLFRKPNIWTH